MNDKNNSRDLLLLNALVDGELAPAERAELAARLAADRNLARGYATLARLKATTMEGVEAAATLDISVPGPQSHRPLVSGAARVAAAAAVVLLLSLAGWLALAPRPDLLVASRSEAAVTLAAFPVRPVVPDLALAGLSLRNVEMRTLSGEPVVVATYKGPRGCRLELQIRSAGAAAAVPGNSSLRHGWTVSGLSYELLAFGMPQTRFSLIVGAAERQTRLNAPETDAQLRQAGIAAPPCIG